MLLTKVKLKKNPEPNLTDKGKIHFWKQMFKIIAGYMCFLIRMINPKIPRCVAIQEPSLWIFRWWMLEFLSEDDFAPWTWITITARAVLEALHWQLLLWERRDQARSINYISKEIFSPGRLLVFNSCHITGTSLSSKSHPLNTYHVLWSPACLLLTLQT